MADTYDDEENKKYVNMRIYVESLYELNKDNPEKLKEALTACAQENRRMTPFCNKLIAAINAKQNSQDAEYTKQIKELADKTHLSTSHKNLADFLSEKRPEVKFAVVVPALEEWTHDQGKDKTAVIDKLNSLDEKYRGTPLEEDFTNIVYAYQNDNFDEIKRLRENMTLDMAHVTMLFDIRNAVCYEDGTTKSHPRGKLPRNVPMTVVSSSSASERKTPVLNQDPVENVNRTVLNGYTSDEWKQILDGSKDGDINPVYLSVLATSLKLEEGIEISSLREILGDKFPQDFDGLSKEEKETKVQELRENLSPVELAKFNISLTKKAEQLAESLPPHQLVVMATDIDALLNKEYSKKEQTEELKQQLENLSKQKEIFVNAMINKTVDVARGSIIVDENNAADVHDGAMEMFEYLAKGENLPESLSEQAKNNLTESLKFAEQKIKEAITKYDQENGLDGIKEGDDNTLEKAFDETWKTVQEADLNNAEQKEEWLGKDLAQLLDSLEFEGNDAVEKKAIFIDTIKLAAARNAAVKGKGKEGDELKTVLKEELQAVGTAYTTSLITTNALANLPENATEEQRKEAINKALQNQTHKISDKGVIAFQAATVNSHVSFLNRLATNLNNRKANVLHKMYGPLAKIDKACIARFGDSYVTARTFGKMMLRNMGAQALNQGLRIGCNLGSLACGVPGVGGYVYAGLYATMATRRFYKAYQDEKAEAVARGEKFGVGKFLLQKAPEIALTAAGTAASIFGGAIAQKGAEAIVRYGMMGAGWTISFCKGIYASRKQGNSWLKSIGKAFGNATASTATAVASGAIISAASVPLSSHLNHTAMDFFNKDNHSASAEDSGDKSLLDKAKDTAARINDPWGEHATRQIHADEYNSDDASFTKDAVNNPDDYKSMSDEQLNENGIIKDEISKGEATDLVSKSDEDLAKEGIVRSTTDETDPNGVKVVDTPEHSAYADGVTKNAENIVKYWTTANPEVHENNISALNATDGELAKWNASHPNQVIDANRLELIVGDCGGQMVGRDIDTLTNHVNGDMNNEHAQEVRGNHKVFGEGWLAEHGKEVGVTAEDIQKIASLHGPDGKIDVSKLDASTLEAINRLDNIVSKNNEVLDTVCARDGAHTDGFLHRNATPDSTTGAHTHTDSKGTLFNTYANGESPKVVTPEQSHYERFDKYSHVEQHNFIPFTVTFDRMWASTKGFVLNRIMGANGRKAEAKENGEQVQSIDAKIGHKTLPQVSDNTPQTQSGSDAPAQNPKGNIFTRIFKRGGSDGK